MADATVFVAIAIGCVIALLLLTAFFIYCIKRHHTKHQNRVQVERQAREERYRRHLNRAQIVRPPPYDAQRQNVMDMPSGPVPFSPPPVYKERATPHPGTDRQGLTVGIGNTPLTPAPSYESQNHQRQISTITRSRPPANTNYSTHQNNQQGPNRNNNSLVVREARNNRDTTTNTTTTTTTNNNNRGSNRNNRDAMTNRNNAINRNSTQEEASIYVISSSRIPPPPDPPSYSSANIRQEAGPGSHTARDTDAISSTATTTTATSSSSSTSSNATYDSINSVPIHRNHGNSRGHARDSSSNMTNQSSGSTRIHTNRSSNGSNLPRQASRSRPGGRGDTSTATNANAALQDLSLI